MLDRYIFYALALGILPALGWLWIWLHEDNAHPEPMRIIFASFIAGAFAAPVVIVLQLYTRHLFGASQIVFMGVSVSLYTVIAWVCIEELLKFAAAFFAIKSKLNDEPVDSMIYLITAALGFVTVENVLFVFNTMLNNGLQLGIANGITRFIGPSLLHIVTSGIIGLVLSLAFYKPLYVKIVYVCIGLVFAITLNTLHNLFIIVDTSNTVIVFSFVWVLALCLLFAFEIVKKIKKHYV